MYNVKVGGTLVGVAGDTFRSLSSTSTDSRIYPQNYIYNQDQDPNTDDYMNVMGHIRTYGSTPWSSYKWTGWLTATSENTYDLRYFLTGTAPLVHAVSSFDTRSANVYAWHSAEGRIMETGSGVQGATSYVSARYTGSGYVSSLNLNQSGAFMPAFSIYRGVFEDQSDLYMSAMSGTINFYGYGPVALVGVE
jgi:hypothetical protein